MTPKDDLFRLIKSLTRSEKRYVKLFASLYGGQKKYLALFDAIDAQSTYDEGALRERFKNERFTAQLTAAKRYLYDQILRSLRACHEKTDARARIRRLIQNMEILYHKGLRDQARAMFDSALQLAIEREDFVSWIEAISWMESMQPTLVADDDGIKFVHDTFIDAFTRYRNLVDIGVAARQIALPLRGGQPRSLEDLEELDRAIDRIPAVDLSVRASIARCTAMATYHFARNEYPQALTHIDRELALFENNPALIDADPRAYIWAINNKLVLLKRAGDFKTFDTVLEATKVRSQKLLVGRGLWTHRLRAEFFAVITLNRANYSLALQLTDKYPDLANEIRRELGEHQRYLRRHVQMKFHMDLTLMYFALGDYRAALEMNNRITSDIRPDQGWETFHQARLMSLVIHYELGNIELLENLIVSTCRFFRSRKIMHAFESIVLDFFRRLVRLKAGRENLLRLFIETRERLNPLQNDPLEANAFRYFQYIGWMDGKIDALRTTRAPCRRTLEASSMD